MGLGTGSRLPLAGVQVDLHVAVLAVHGAAPMELALTLGGAANARRVVAPPTAHDLTAVHATGRPVAHPPARPEGPWREREGERG